MRYKIVLVPFPFDDFSSFKVRPAICLTDKIGKFEHVVIAFITSQLKGDKSASDIVIEKASKHFERTGLKVTSSIRLHRLVTVPVELIKRELGVASLPLQKEIKLKLKELFELK